MIDWVEQLCLGDKPFNMIDPSTYFFEQKYLICMSTYKGFNCFILNFITATGKNINLITENIFGNLQLMKRHFGVLNNGSKVMVSAYDEEKKILENTIFDLETALS